MGTTWHAHVRIEKNGEAAEYNDTVSTLRHTPMKEEIKEEVVAAIIAHSPHLNGSWITHSDIRRVR